VHHAGAPSLDHLKRSPLLDRTTLEAKLAIKFSTPTILAAWHPVTILENTNAEADALFAALAAAPASCCSSIPTPMRKLRFD